MHSRLWLAYALLIGPALSKEPLSTLPLNLISPASTDASDSNNSLGLRLPTSNIVTQQPSNSSHLYDLSSAEDFTFTTGNDPKCDDHQFGIDLDRLSCFDAWRNIAPTDERKNWGPRRQGTYDDETLPFRWSSGKFATNVIIQPFQASLTSS